MSNSQSFQDKAVLIPAVGTLGTKFRSYSFYLNSPAFVPILSRSTLSLVLDKYLEANVHVYIAVDKSLESIFEKELLYYSGKFTLILLDSTLGINETIKLAIEYIKESEIIINIVSTIPNNLARLNEVKLGNIEFSHNEYSGVYFELGTTKFKSKFSQTNIPSWPFQGIFSSTKSHISEAISNLEIWTDMLYLIEAISKLLPLTFTKENWFDTGHESNYPSIRKKLITSRSFNRLSFDEKTGILTKFSENREKLCHEIEYIQKLPWQLQVYYPRIFSFESVEGKVHMEYYGYPNLSEYQLYRQITNEQWGIIFAQLQHFISKNLNYKNPLHFEFYWDLLITKSENRIFQYISNLPLSHLFRNREIRINDVNCLNFEALSDKIHEMAKSMYNPQYHAIMHGDLCFNNILYDVFSETLRLIDPRGSVNSDCVGIYGDIRYDLAKLLHSAVGNYDYMVNNLFEFNMNDSHIEFTFPQRENANAIHSHCDKLIENLGVNKNEIYFIMGLLFISMPPLHSDNPKRQLIMYSQGIYFLNQSLKNA